MATACPDCGALLSFPPLPRRSTAVCLRCRTPVESTIGRSVDAALACSLATLLLLPPIDTLPLLEAQFLGESSRQSLTAGVLRLWHHDWITLAGLSAVFVILLAVGVGYYYLTRIEHLGIRIDTGGGLLLLGGLLTMLSRATLDERTVWRAIGCETGAVPHDRATGCGTCGLILPRTREDAPCPRCGARSRTPKPAAAAGAAALVAASFILFLPANLYPMSVSDLLGAHYTYTNFGYVRQLWHRGLWELGALTFWTSIVTPALMMASVGWSVLSVAWRSRRRLVLKTRLLRMVVETGRWSETGPLSIVFYAPLIDFGRFGAESAGWGATAYIVMTLLLIAAALTFDSRLFWDAPARTGIAGQVPGGNA